jgi:transcriptional regulator with XRE-family HTH domain
MRYHFDASELQRRREAAGLTRHDLAHRLGRTTASVCHYEAGRTYPSMGVMLRLCTELGCQPSDLLRPVIEPVAS